MSLPVSAEQHHVHPQNYASNQPPFLPNVAVLPEARALLVHAASIVANSAGYLSTQTNARMFCYNMLAAHNWANQSFAEVVKLTCDNAVMKARNGEANTAGTALNDAAEEALTLYTSYLASSFPEMGRMMSPEQVSGAAANAQIYHELQAAIDYMYAQSGNGVQSQPIVGSRAQHVGRSAMPLTHGAVGNVQHTAHHGRVVGNKAAESAYVGRGQLKEKPIGRFSAARLAQKQQETTAQIPEEAPSNPNVLTGEIESMDRKAHSIAYFGKEYSIPTSPLRRAMEESVEAHEAISATEFEDDSQYVSKAMEVEASLDELISVTRAKRCADDPNLSVYLSSGLVVTPIISAVPMDKLFVQLAEAKTFSAIARILRDHLDGITDKDLLRQTVAYVAQIDRVLTNILNDFLLNMLPLRASVDSFIEDAMGTTDYLNKKDGGIYNKPYIDYQRHIVEHLFQHTRAAAAKDDLVAQVTDYDAKAYWDNIVIAYSLTYINATSQELGYTISKVAREINDAATPMFSRLMNATQQTYAKGVMLSHHLVITSDDARYRLYLRAGTTTAYTIKEI